MLLFSYLFFIYIKRGNDNLGSSCLFFKS